MSANTVPVFAEGQEKWSASVTTILDTKKRKKLVKHI